MRRSDGQLVQLSDLLYLIVEEIDEQKNYEEVAAAVSERYGRTVSPENVRQLVTKRLQPDGLVVGPGGAAPKPEALDPLLQLKLRVTLVPQSVVNFFAALLRPLFWPPVMVAVLGGFVALDIWYFGMHGIGQGLRGAIYQPLLILALYGLLVLSIAWHELGHATACRYGGARPGKIGFGIYIVWPAFYTDVTDVYRLRKAGRVRTDLGGIYFNAIFALAIAGIYFLTGYEPLLVVVLLQHLLMLYQFMPFLRLDGYYVVSDLTGIPDLFARIKPTLAGLVPWKRSPRQVTELKPWARLVVSIWVLTVIPVLFYLFGMMVLSAPRLLSTAWDSAGVQWERISGAMDQGQAAAAATGGLRVGMLFLPLLGMSVTFTRVSKRGLVGLGNLVRRRPVVGGAAALLVVTALGAGAFVLWPNGEYRPIQSAEIWTIPESIDALRAVDTGRPSLTQERQEQLGDAPFQSRLEPDDRDLPNGRAPTPGPTPTVYEETPAETTSPSPTP